MTRFWERVDKTEDCWIWTGANNGNGYGRLSVDGRLQYAHRWAYQLTHGEIPDDLVIDHLCRTRACVRPEHLQAVPAAVNIRRGVLGFDLTGKCRAGLHDVSDPSNISVRPDGGRRCRPCELQHRKDRWAAELQSREASA